MPANAEDVVEDAFLKTWQRVEAGLEIDNFRSFIYRAVHNECVSFLRAKKETVEIDAIAEIGDEEIDTSIRDARIWQAVDRLPDKCREIFSDEQARRHDQRGNCRRTRPLGKNSQKPTYQSLLAYARSPLPRPQALFLPFL